MRILASPSHKELCRSPNTSAGRVPSPPRGEDSGEGDRQTHQIPNLRNPRLRSFAESVALSFLWVPAFAGMTACYAKISSEGEDPCAIAQRGEGDTQSIRSTCVPPWLSGFHPLFVFPAQLVDGLGIGRSITAR